MKYLKNSANIIMIMKLRLSHQIGILILLLYSSITSAQIPFFNQFKVNYNGSELNQSDTTILIRYDLKGPKKRYYDVKLFYSNNEGASFKGPLKSAQGISEGDYGDSIRVGKGKQISWDFMNDNPYFNGRDIIFRIEATEIPKIAKGTERETWRSIVMPGWGDTRVRNRYNYGWITFATYASLATGGLFYWQSERLYQDYLDRVPNTESEHRDLFNRARTNRQLAQVFFITGITVWIADIVGVYLRGRKNRLEFFPKEVGEEEQKNVLLIHPSFIPQPNGMNAMTGIGFTWRF